ncbi:MAG: AAA family ATPase [Leptospirillia bacterium]
MEKLPAYLSYWGLNEAPFSLAPNPAMFYLSDQHRECLMRLKFAIHSGKGGALLISENAGDGKTTSLNLLMQELEDEFEGRIRTAFLDYPTMTPTQMVAEIARQLGVENLQKDKVEDLNALREVLRARHRDGIHSLVIVDEGQMLADRPDLLQEFRILLNFCSSGEFLLSFILSGQAPLEPAVRAMPEFWQRLPVRFFLKNLHFADTAAMIRHRVQVAGATRPIFTDTATEGIFRYSKGCPRVICAVSDLSLVIGHSNRARQVDFAEVTQACSDMEHTGPSYHYFNFLEDDAAAQQPSDHGVAPEPPPMAAPEPPPMAAPEPPPVARPEPEPVTAFTPPTPNVGAPPVFTAADAGIGEAPPVVTTGSGGMPQEVPPPRMTFSLADSGVAEAPEMAATEPVAVAPPIPETAPNPTAAPQSPSQQADTPPDPTTVDDPSLVMCPSCGHRGMGETETCPRCDGPLKVSCGRCKTVQSLLHKACAYCGFPLSGWAAGAEQEFLQGLKRLNLYRPPRDTEAFKFSHHRTLDGRVLYFADRARAFREGARMREVRNGHNGRMQGCGVIIGNRRLVFLKGGAAVDIPLERVDACEVLPEAAARGKKGGQGGIVVRYRETSFEVEFPVREGRRVAFHRLVHAYLNRMREARS